MDKIKKFLLLLKELRNNKWTGRIILNFHKGNLSDKIGRKEEIKL